MNAEAEGGKLSSQIKTDEHTAWTRLPKILHDQNVYRCSYVLLVFVCIYVY